jgi:hypothetical protein
MRRIRQAANRLRVAAAGQHAQREPSNEQPKPEYLQKANVALPNRIVFVLHQ